MIVLRSNGSVSFNYHRQHVITCRLSRESWRGQIPRLVKQTNSPFRFNTRGCGFITAVQMIRNVFWAVLLGVCTYQIYHTLSWHSKEVIAIVIWPEIRVKFEAWNLIQIQLWDVTSDILCHAINRFSWCFTNNKAKNVVLVSIIWKRIS